VLDDSWLVARRNSVKPLFEKAVENPDKHIKKHNARRINLSFNSQQALYVSRLTNPV
jgi:hypothetical protein